MKNTHAWLVRAARYSAGLAAEVPQMVLVLGSAIAAGTYAWNHGYTVPGAGASTALAAAITVGALAAVVVANLTRPWTVRLRDAVLGIPIVPCPGCGALVEAADVDQAVKETAK
ncbi:hypothetical protein ACFC5T_40350 [Streptomyces sp. NPDC055961]|uniref:hypothetical protein n=1 Tax=Streptomyces sp. NPDC055961 TaxID=3345666 RepID=UPI0035DE0DE5